MYKILRTGENLDVVIAVSPHDLPVLDPDVKFYRRRAEKEEDFTEIPRKLGLDYTTRKHDWCCGHEVVPSTLFGSLPEIIDYIKQRQDQLARYRKPHS